MILLGDLHLGVKKFDREICRRQVEYLKRIIDKASEYEIIGLWYLSLKSYPKLFKYLTAVLGSIFKSFPTCSAEPNFLYSGSI